MFHNFIFQNYDYEVQKSSEFSFFNVSLIFVTDFYFDITNGTTTETKGQKWNEKMTTSR